MQLQLDVASATVGRATLFLLPIINPTMNRLTLEPSAVRQVRTKRGELKLSVEDVLRQLMSDWMGMERFDHLKAFRAREGIPPFELVHIPQETYVNRRKLAHIRVADLGCVVALICSLPGDSHHIIEQAKALQKHCGIEPASNLQHKPIEAQPLSAQQLLQRQDNILAQQPAPSTSEIYAAVLYALPPEAGNAKGQRYQFNNTTIHMLVDVHGDPWFRGISIAEALVYHLPKEALKQFVSKQRKVKREALPMITTMSKCEREAVWISTQGVRDLVENSKSNQKDYFWHWLFQTAIHPAYNRIDIVTQAPSSTPELPSSEYMTEENMSNTNIAAQHMLVVYRLKLLQLATLAHTFSKELGIDLPPTLRPEYLMQEASSTPEPQSCMTSKQLQQMEHASKRISVINDRLNKKAARLDLALTTRRFANECGIHVGEAQLLAERQAIEMASTHAHLDDDGWFIAGDYLRYCRGHCEDEVQQLQSSFGKQLKATYVQLRQMPPGTAARDYQKNEVQTCLYHASRDRALLNAAYQAFALTDLYRRLTPHDVQAVNTM